MAILEVATFNLQKWRGFAQSLGPCMPICYLTPPNGGTSNKNYISKKMLKRQVPIAVRFGTLVIDQKCLF